MTSALRHVLPAVNRDGKIVIAAASVRSLGYGFMSVFLGVYLDLLEFTPLQAGFVFSAIMAGGALSNVVASWRGDAIGRRRMLIGMAALMSLGGFLFPISEQTALLIAISLIAMTTSSGGDRTAFLSIDMAILAQSGRARQRTALFSLYNLAGRLTKAIGSAAVGLPALAQWLFGVDAILSYKLMFFGYAAFALCCLAIYWKLSPNAEPPATRRADDGDGDAAEPEKMSRESRSIIVRLSLLFTMDSLGGGFMVNAYLSYFFANRFEMDAGTIGLIFFIGSLLNTLSIILAAPTAQRIGLILTMAASQGIANSMLILMALTGTPALAVAFFLIRELINDMDIPTREAYTMAIVPPGARTSAAGLTNLGRTLAQAVAPLFGGYVATATALGAPILIGSAVKLGYNALLYAMFRTVQTPDETDE